MTSRKGGADMSENKPAEQASDGLGRMAASRRNLLKAGAIGAPLVLTFRSTSAWAISAGCIVEEGTLPIPGSIIQVDENGNPVENPNWDGVTADDQYLKIFVSKDPNGTEADAIAGSELTPDELRALVYNQNIGHSCMVSIMQGALN